MTYKEASLTRELSRTIAANQGLGFVKLPHPVPPAGPPSPPRGPKGARHSFIIFPVAARRRGEQTAIPSAPKYGWAVSVPGRSPEFLNIYLHYLYRKATMGSRRPARRAGRYPAAQATS